MQKPGRVPGFLLFAGIIAGYEFRIFPLPAPG